MQWCVNVVATDDTNIVPVNAGCIVDIPASGIAINVQHQDTQNPQAEHNSNRHN
jgi:hypothetical protein